MEENTKKLVNEINTLVEINNDRIEGYKTALLETKDSDLKELFKDMADHSFKFKNELADQVLKLGAQPTESTKTSGKLYRAWMDIKVALSRQDRKAIVESCEFGEDQALKTYEEVLKQNHFPPHVREMIARQKEILRQDHDRIRELRDREKSAA
ncbi:MAG: PA2169 family four-helix-bundle protein [Bacteroidota bacterium]